jgi:hypothetical protein
VFNYTELGFTFIGRKWYDWLITDSDATTIDTTAAYVANPQPDSTVLAEHIAPYALFRGVGGDPVLPAGVFTVGMGLVVHDFTPDGNYLSLPPEDEVPGVLSDPDADWLITEFSGFSNGSALVQEVNMFTEGPQVTRAKSRRKLEDNRGVLMVIEATVDTPDELTSVNFEASLVARALIANGR